MKNAKISGRLTKRFLFSLPDGLYLVSNVMEAPGQPMFAETVAPISGRTAQWQRILKAAANSRTCHVFADPAEFIKFSLNIPFARDRN